MSERAFLSEYHRTFLSEYHRKCEDRQKRDHAHLLLELEEAADGHLGTSPHGNQHTRFHFTANGKQIRYDYNSRGELYDLNED